MWKKCDSVHHLVSRCEKLAQKEYERWHDNVAKKVHWDLCKKNGSQQTEKWYEHVPEGAVENEEVKMMLDVNVHCGKVIEARRPDITLIDKKDNHPYCCTSWYKSRGKRKGENGKVAVLKERHWQIVEN